MGLRGPRTYGGSGGGNPVPVTRPPWVALDGTKKKARLVVRGDEQVWDDWDSAYIDEELDTFTFGDVSKIQDPNSGSGSGSSDAKNAESNSGSNSQNGSINYRILRHVRW